ncbi:MAG: hypothetical protein HRT35_33415, partial [Algicola sp.]|nr:hypothetical protein [Algicola sp.]
MNKNIISRFTFVVIAATSFFCSHQSMAGANLDDELAYVVTIAADNHKIAKVTATFTPQDKNLYMFHGANSQPKRWATFVSDLTVKDSNNQPIKVTETDDAGWSLDTVGNGPITVSYQLNLDHEKY